MVVVASLEVMTVEIKEVEVEIAVVRKLEAEVTVDDEVVVVLLPAEPVDDVEEAEDALEEEACEEDTEEDALPTAAVEAFERAELTAPPALDVAAEKILPAWAETLATQRAETTVASVTFILMMCVCLDNIRLLLRISDLKE